MPTAGWWSGDISANNHNRHAGRRQCVHLAVVVLLVLAAAKGMAQVPVPAGQTCLILSQPSGLALQVENADEGNLTNIEVAKRNGGAGQCWRMIPERYEDAVAIVSLKSGRVADVMGYSRKDGANVQQFKDFGSQNQRWRIVPAGGDDVRLVAMHSGKCMTVTGGGIEGADVRQMECGTGGDDLWRFEAYPHSDTLYRIVSRLSGKALDVDGRSKEDGANIQQFRLNGGPNQLWSLYPDGELDGSPVYSIISYHSGKAADVMGADIGDGANVQQYSFNGGGNQRWKFLPAGEGEVHIVSVNSGQCLDVKGESTEDGANIQQAACNGGNNQRWRLLPEAAATGEFATDP